MISSTDGYGEGWDMIDAIPDGEICSSAITPDHKKQPIPTVVHYCQVYGVGDVFFSKYLIPPNIFTCESPLLVEPVDDVMSPDNAYMLKVDGGKNDFNPKMHKRNAFATCALTSALNEAALFFKLHHCDKSESNKERQILLVKRKV